MNVSFALARSAVFALGLATSLPCHATSVAPPESHVVAELRELDITYKTVKLRKLSRIVLGHGAAIHDERPITIGRIRMALMWRLAWKWNTERPERRAPHGLRGGPMLSLDLPMLPWLSLETQLGSFRYVYSRSLPESHLTADGPCPSGARRSVEAGLFLNLHFDGLL